MQTKVRAIMNAGRVRLYSDQHRQFVQGPKDPAFRLSLDNKIVRVIAVAPIGKASFLRLI